MTWVSYEHYFHSPENNDVEPDCEGEGWIQEFAPKREDETWDEYYETRGPADAWIVDETNKRRVFYGHCAMAGPIAPKEISGEEFPIWKCCE